MVDQSSPGDKFVVSADNEMIGSLGETLWHDRSGFDVVSVARDGPDVVVPIWHDKMFKPEHVAIEYTASQVFSAPTLAELIVGGQDAVGRIADHYEIALEGPPPGPPSTPVPPWWRTKAEGDEPGKG